MLKRYNITEINDILVEYIEHNKNVNNISYKETTDILRELLEEIDREYQEVLISELKQLEDYETMYNGEIEYVYKNRIADIIEELKRY